MFDHFDALAGDDSAGFEVIWNKINLRSIQRRLNRLELSGSTACVDWIVGGKEDVEEELE